VGELGVGRWKWKLDDYKLATSDPRIYLGG